MLAYLTVGNEQLHETSTRSLTRVSGLIGIPGIRGIVYDRPEDDGSVEPNRQYQQSRIVVIEGECWGPTIDAAWTDFAAVATQLESSINTAIQLKWQHYAGSAQLQGDIRLAGEILPVLDASEQGPRIAYQATVRASDPRWYSQTLTSVAIGQPASGPAVCTNAGNTLTYPLITITGPIVNPTITNSTQSKAVAFSLTVSAGQSLIVQMLPSARAATKGGVSVLGSMTWSTSHFFGIGANATENINYSGSSTTSATTMTVAFRSAYSV